ncbi:universal stress protein [Porticoccus sp. W117]|uniref:universal stress protein n=1 Tax=Porticoccus sp. W117 TaxID=3054777 RepID=UPI00259761E9|nr:universal stress protein [Porticoccus sp. W117]MDM3871822.1 universal stress protein [Porticoccus sp. W117]
MSTQETVLVVVDPQQDTHPAMDRAIANAKIRKPEERSRLVILVTPDTDDLAKTPVIKGQAWLSGLMSMAFQDKVEYQLELGWGASLPQVLHNAVEKYQANLVMLPLYKNGNDKVLNDDRWNFLRNAQTPVLLIRPENNRPRKKLLAAIKVQDSKYQQLNQTVASRGQWAAQRYNADLHLVNCYSDSMNFPDRSAIARLADVPNERIHVQQGDPDQVIPRVAKDIDADMILVGTQRRTGLKGALRGNTIEKIIRGLPQDVMMLV